MNSLWLDEKPLVLASGSVARRRMLEAAAIPLAIVKPELDEAAIARDLLARGADPAAIAMALAKAKGAAVSGQNPDHLVIAADQTLDCQGRLGMKPPSLAAAREQLMALRGKNHRLHSAAVLIRGGQLLWAGQESAELQMRAFSDAFLAAYLAHMGAAVLGTVGAYELEGLGIHLFSDIRGSQPAVLGLPLSGLLEALRALEFLRA